VNDAMLRDLLRRVTALERQRVLVRRGEVIATGPLDVALGGSDVAYEDVKQLGAETLVVGDQVAVLMWGGDLVVLGTIV
jgi:hypothetical protein